MCCLHSFMLGMGLFGKPVWGMVGVVGCFWWVSPYPSGQACWRCLAVPVLFGWVFPLEISGLGGDVLHPS